jgi:uncharacterized integral membrane protein (TIGR00698 family)
LGKILPGALLATAIMLIALPLADVFGNAILAVQGIDPAGKASPVSGVLIAIIIGIGVRNIRPMPLIFNDGIRFSINRLLRIGIICIGIKLSFLDILKLGSWGIPVVLTAIVSGMVFISWFNHVLDLPDRLGTLIAAGTSICGVTAIVSTAPAINAEEKEVAYAVANVTVFGLIGMFAYPYLAHVLLASPEQVGLFLGTAVHETAQVVGSAMTYSEVFQDPRVLQAATVTKLTRNLFLAVVVPILSYRYMKTSKSETTDRVDIRTLFPMFILGFVAMAIVRSLGDAFWNTPLWKTITLQVGDVWGSHYLLGTAMAAVGLGTSFSVFKGVGLKPFIVGLAGAVLVGLVGFLMALLLGPFVHL